MQQEALDKDFAPLPENGTKVIYGKFWPRTGALIIDAIILGVPVFIISYLNIGWKNIPLMILSSVAALAYKPVMEYVYGATLGKMALGLKVVNLSFGPPSIEAVLLRNIFNLASGFFSIIFSVVLFLSPEFQDVTGFMEYATLQAERPERYIQWVVNLITIVEIIFLLTDDRCRSLHDRIGNTYVVAK